MKLGGKNKKGKDQDKVTNIPDIIDIYKEDKNTKKIREDNKEPEAVEKSPKGKCDKCFIY